jgi:hypothetical protein
MRPYSLSQSHEYIFQTYQELKRILPPEFFKMKVLEKQKYPTKKNIIINEIEKNYKRSDINLKKKVFSSSQNINIFYNSKEEEAKKKNILPKIKQINNENNNSVQLKTKKQTNIKTNPLFDNNSSIEIITYRNFREKNMKMIGINCDNKLKRQKGLFNSFSVNDIDMKKNLYLPRIIDRMKYSMPRNIRNNKGFIVKGNNVYEILDKYKEIKFIKNKNDSPTDLFFYNDSKKPKLKSL